MGLVIFILSMLGLLTWSGFVYWLALSSHAKAIGFRLWMGRFWTPA